MFYCIWMIFMSSVRSRKKVSIDEESSKRREFHCKPILKMKSVSCFYDSPLPGSVMELVLINRIWNWMKMIIGFCIYKSFRLVLGFFQNFEEWLRLNSKAFNEIRWIGFFEIENILESFSTLEIESNILCHIEWWCEMLIVIKYNQKMRKIRQER